MSQRARRWLIQTPGERGFDAEMLTYPLTWIIHEPRLPQMQGAVLSKDRFARGSLSYSSLEVGG
jgi:hypothetical protein